MPPGLEAHQVGDARLRIGHAFQHRLVGRGGQRGARAELGQGIAGRGRDCRFRGPGLDAGRERRCKVRRRGGAGRERAGACQEASS